MHASREEETENKMEEKKSRAALAAATTRLVQVFERKTYFDAWQKLALFNLEMGNVEEANAMMAKAQHALSMQVKPPAVTGINAAVESMQGFQRMASLYTQMGNLEKAEEMIAKAKEMAAKAEQALSLQVEPR